MTVSDRRLLTLRLLLTDDKLTNNLYLLQKKALRLVCKGIIPPASSKNKLISTDQAIKHTSILPLPDLALYFTCVAGHSIRHNHCPPYLSALFLAKQHTHATRCRNQLTSSIHHNALNLNMLTTFNSLPTKLRTLPRKTFEFYLHKYFLTR